MTNQYKYFMIAAEEKNLKRAADRAFISPQGMSSAIRQLEHELGVVLFNRTPKLTLTPEGEILVKAVNEMQAVEENMFLQFADSTHQYKIALNVGIESCCYTILVPNVVPAFLALYPNATINIVSDFSEKMEYATARNDLDLYVGEGTPSNENLQVLPLIEEKYYLLVSKNILQKYFGTSWEAVAAKRNEACDFLDFLHIPFIQYPVPSRLGQRISQFADAHQTALTVIFESNNVDIFPMLCHNDLGAAIASEFHLGPLKILNQSLFSDNPVYAFLLSPFDTNTDMISLAYYKRKYMTKCHKDLISLIVDTMQKFGGNLATD